MIFWFYVFNQDFPYTDGISNPIKFWFLDGKFTVFCENLELRISHEINFKSKREVMKSEIEQSSTSQRNA